MTLKKFNSIEFFLTEILRKIQAKKTKTFSGLGIIFYTSIDDLPCISLRGLKADKPKLPIVGVENISNILIKVSDIKNSWHDGFHLINVDNFELTHISQYLSPPINKYLLENNDEYPKGARQMTALFTSSLKFIEYACVLNTKNEITIYRHGKIG